MELKNPLEARGIIDLVQVDDELMRWYRPDVAPAAAVRPLPPARPGVSLRGRHGGTPARAGAAAATSALHQRYRPTATASRINPRRSGKVLFPRVVAQLGKPTTFPRVGL